MKNRTPQTLTEVVRDYRAHNDQLEASLAAQESTTGLLRRLEADNIRREQCSR